MIERSREQHPKPDILSTLVTKAQTAERGGYTAKGAVEIALKEYGFKDTDPLRSLYFSAVMIELKKATSHEIKQKKISPALRESMIKDSAFIAEHIRRDQDTDVE